MKTVDAGKTSDWDHIVIGAGSAGAIVAARLSEDPACRVLLIEAGGEGSELRFRVPAMSSAAALGDPACDWLFATEADPTRLGRTDVWFRGKVLGGSSQLNGTIYVRGNRGDYDHWAQLGNIGWDYDTMLGYFRKLEHGVGPLAGNYGDSGPVHISQPRGVHPVCKAFVAGLAQLGVPENANYNGEEQTGGAIAHVNQRAGLRESTAHSYLRPARKRPNLTIETGAMVRRIIFEGRRAVAVEFDQGGTTRVERSRHDIVISASAFNAPKLLMLSGIGDPEHLASHGIAVVHANKNVGRHLQEHPNVPLKAFVKGRTSNQDMGVLGMTKNALRFLFTRSGPATYIFPTIAFAKTDPILQYPDLQFHFGAWVCDITPEGSKWLDRPGVTMLVNVNRSTSNGYVQLRSADPFDPPLIQPNMLGDQHEVELLKQAVRLGRKLWKTPAFAPWFDEEYSPGCELAEDDDESLEAFIRREASPGYHACGTVKMGIDETAVVDPRLRVYGVENLRVIDCSIIPQVPSGNINAISMAIGEKGADMIKEDRR